MSDIFTELETDHQAVLRMAQELETSGLADDARGRIVERLVMEESKHEAAEEMWFWPAVREFVSNGEGLRNPGLDQEEDGKKLLQPLSKTPSANPDFDRLLGEELDRIHGEVGLQRLAKGVFPTASRLFERMIKQDEFDEFLTLPAYELID